MYIKYRKEPGSSFVRQRRNLIGISSVITVYYLLGGSIKKVPTFLGAVEIVRAEYIEHLLTILLLYFAWRFYVYLQIESATWFQDINDALNRSKGFLNTARHAFNSQCAPEGGQFNISTNAYIFIDKILPKCAIRVMSYQKINANGSSSGHNINLDFSAQSDISKGGGESAYISFWTLLRYLPKTVLKTITGYPGFTDFILPWLLFALAIVVIISTHFFPTWPQAILPPKI